MENSFPWPHQPYFQGSAVPMWGSGSLGNMVKPESDCVVAVFVILQKFPIIPRAKVKVLTKVPKPLPSAPACASISSLASLLLNNSAMATSPSQDFSDPPGLLVSQVLQPCWSLCWDVPTCHLHIITSCFLMSFRSLFKCYLSESLPGHSILNWCPHPHLDSFPEPFCPLSAATLWETSGFYFGEVFTISPPPPTECELSEGKSCVCFPHG